MQNSILDDIDISTIQAIGFPEFNGENVNIKDDSKNSILIMLITKIYLVRSGLRLKSAFNRLCYFPEEDADRLIIISYKILENPKLDINAANQVGNTALAMAIGHGYEGLVEKMLNLRPDLQSKYYESDFGDEYIDLAMGINQFGIAKLLKEYN